VFATVAPAAASLGIERMDERGSANVFPFEGFRLDCDRGVLFRLDAGGGAEPVALGSRAFDLLRLLVERHGDLISQDAIMKTVWAGRAVEPANLNVQIAKLRHILDQDREQGSCIQTIPGRGYRFAAPVTRPSGAERPAVTPISEGGTLPLPRLSIVVLPFADLSEGGKQQYFADGIADDLTTDLSRIGDMLVISRNTAFTYRDKPADTKQIGCDLRVRYVLEGSVRRAGNQIRVNAQLIDAETDAHLWAERFDRDMGELFALQNEITSRIAVALNSELVNAEAARPTDRLDALDCIFRGRAAAWGRPPSAENFAEAIGLFERALTLDPGSVGAQSWLASVLANRLLDFPNNTFDGDIKRAAELASKAVAASPRSPLPHFAKGQVLRVQKSYEEAITEFETVLMFNQNWVGALFALGWCKFHTGSIEAMIPLLEQVIRLSPRDPFIGIWYGRIGIAHLLQSRIDEAIVWLEKARSAIPSRPFTRSSLAVAYALKGETDLAAAEMDEARLLSPDGRYSSIARLKRVGYIGVPKIRDLYESIYLTGYRKAGMPEE
jgi:adenylate cyclase